MNMSHAHFVFIYLIEMVIFLWVEYIRILHNPTTFDVNSFLQWDCDNHFWKLPHPYVDTIVPFIYLRQKFAKTHKKPILKYK